MSRSITSFSSDALSSLLTWRNPNGGEENWYQGRGPVYHREITKVIFTEVALPFVAVAALAETVFLTIVLLALLIPAFLDENIRRVCGTSLSMIESATFTAAWSLADLFSNLTSTNLFTQEFFARRAAGFAQYREMRAIIDWERDHPLPEVDAQPLPPRQPRQPRRPAQPVELRPQPPRARTEADQIAEAREQAKLAKAKEAEADVERERLNRLIVGGGLLIANDILKDVTDVTRGFFLDEEFVYDFVCAKGVYIYACQRPKADIPEFFKPDVRDKINGIRLLMQETNPIMMSNLLLVVFDAWDREMGPIAKNKGTVEDAETDPWIITQQVLKKTNYAGLPKAHHDRLVALKESLSNVSIPDYNRLMQVAHQIFKIIHVAGNVEFSEKPGLFAGKCWHHAMQIMPPTK